jgi:LmbE family N-acetylglucosaminyl deacetylase
MKLFISPHNDDETLFGAFTLLREHPLVLVVTDSYIQFNRGDGISARQRRDETIEAMHILGCSTFFAGLRDDQLDEQSLRKLFESLTGFEEVYVPMPYQNGNPHHNLIGQIASVILPHTTFYATYTKDNLYKTGKTEIEPKPDELELKFRALQCYKTQLNLPSTRPHFEAVLGRSEWYA